MTWPGSDTPPGLEGYDKGGRETPPTLTELSLAMEMCSQQHKV